MRITEQRWNGIRRITYRWTFGAGRWQVAVTRQVTVERDRGVAPDPGQGAPPSHARRGED